MNRQKNLSVRFTDDTKAELKRLHESHEIKPAAPVRIAVDRFLASDETYAARPETAQPTKAKRVASP